MCYVYFLPSVRPSWYKNMKCESNLSIINSNSNNYLIFLFPSHGLTASCALWLFIPTILLATLFWLTLTHSKRKKKTDKKKENKQIKVLKKQMYLVWRLKKIFSHLHFHWLFAQTTNIQSARPPLLGLEIQWACFILVKPTPPRRDYQMFPVNCWEEREIFSPTTTPMSLPSL